MSQPPASLFSFRIAAAASQPNDDRRCLALDGMRGLMTLFVLVSHYFAELPGGVRVFAFGWVAVDMFFVLSGLLVGRLILEKGGAENFLAVFYARRVCRTFPVYFACLTLAAAGLWSLGVRAGDGQLAAASYLTFTQNISMVVRDTVGAPWLAPTWTLALEEQFYLIIPILMLLTPRKVVAPLLVAIIATAVACRLSLEVLGTGSLAGAVLLPCRADTLACGVLAALVAVNRPAWLRHSAWRVAPVILVFGAAALKLIDGSDGQLFPVLGHLFISLALAAFLLALVGNAPEAKRFQSAALRFFGTISYSVYLTHLPILWALHHVILGSEPAIDSWPGVLVTLAAIPVCLGASVALTRAVEMPLTAYGRNWRWRFSRGGAPALPVPALIGGPTFSGEEPRLAAAVLPA